MLSVSTPADKKTEGEAKMSGPIAGAIESSSSQLVRHHSWNQLRDAAKETRRQQTTIASRVPSSFVFRVVENDSGKRTRLYFLGVPKHNRENSIMYVDIPEREGNAESNTNTPLQWKCLLDSFQVG